MLMTQTAVPALFQGQNNNYNSRKKPSRENLNHDATNYYPSQPALDSSSVGQAFSPYSQAIPSSSSIMNGIAGTAPPGTMYVRALYDYEADDRTSLSFHEGDVIQVITQLESGWWDGVINGVRGWFPSNYCQIVTSPDEIPEHDQNGDLDHVDDDEDNQEVYDEQLEEDDESELDDASGLPLEGTDLGDKSRADFWIPQATPDGRLFYYNMMTGDRSMELPLESPVSTNETGPRNRINVNVPEKTRPPPEMMARGLTQDEDEDSEANSASELEGESLMLASRGSLVRAHSAKLAPPWVAFADQCMCMVAS
ncbi:RasGEF domain-containing protein [Colletotrichum acutatum]